MGVATPHHSGALHLRRVRVAQFDTGRPGLFETHVGSEGRADEASRSQDCESAARTNARPDRSHAVRESRLSTPCSTPD